MDGLGRQVGGDSTLTSRVRKNYHGQLAKVGRWSAPEHFEIAGPGRLDPGDVRRPGRQMLIGELIQRGIVVAAAEASRCLRGRRLVTSTRSARSSATARNGSGSRVASIRCEHCPRRAA